VNNEEVRRCQGQAERLVTIFFCEEAAVEKLEALKTRSYWPTAQTIHKQLKGEAHG
jgi:hypothetical protein